MIGRLKLWAALTALAILLTGCTGGEEPGASSPARATEAARVPELPEAWTSTAVDPYRIRSVLAVGDVVLVSTDRTVVALDAATGERQWRLPSVGVCGRPEPTGDGRVVVALSPRGEAKGRQRRAECTTLALVDAGSGKVAWQRNVGSIWGNTDGEQHAIAVGRRAITAREDTVCGGLRRFDLRTGRPLPSLAPVGNDGYACDSWAFDGRWIAQEETPDFGDADVLTLYDADSGRRVFSRPFPDLALGEHIYSADPLVLDISDHGHRLLWTVDPTNGKLLEPISEQWTDNRFDTDTAPLGMDGDTVLVDHGSQVSGYSLAGLSGGTPVTTAFPANGQFLGTGDGLIAATQLVDDGALGQMVLTRHAADDVADVEVLGATEGRTFAGVAGDLVLVQAQEELVAHALPAPGAGPDVPEDLDIPWDVEPALQGYDESRWEDGDVRPGDVEDCRLSDATLRTLGFHRLDLPRPARCEWVETVEPHGTRRELSITTIVGGPLAGDGGNATDEARERLASIHRNGVAGSAIFDPLATKAVRLPGVGDEAWLVHGAGLGARDTNVGLLVRVRNVVVHLTMQQTTESYETSGLATPYAIEEGAWAALEETFEGAGLTLTRPTPDVPDVPALKRRPDLCRLLGPSVAGLVPGVAGKDLRPKGDAERRVAGCAWNTGGADGNHDGVQVSLHATASSTLTGTSGVGLARRAWTYTAKALDDADDNRTVDGLGERARVVGWDATWLQGRVGDAKKWQAARVDVRRRNLTVTVVVQLHGLSTDTLEERAIALARDALATQGG
ncbi:PQQ-binding-like beta-propeller repeat protein [Nocardioides caeni]|uniref:outer membrane protein assembly factor BamB family protein n=1 Tax=Nocardioides caeni TaxID=574700 RepID=UPI0031EB081F